MQKFLRIVILLLISQPAWALSPEAIRIFSRQNRLYAPPPKHVRAERSRSFYAANDRKKKFEDLEISSQARSGEAEEAEETIEESPVEEPLQREKLKKKRSRSGEDAQNGSPKKRAFGIGLVGGGAYGIFGMEFDFHIVDQWSAGFGLGTGMAYETWGLHSRFFFMEGTFSPFTQMGYANWYLRRSSQTGEKLRPAFIAQRFFDENNGQVSAQKRVHLVYGGIGVMHQSANDVAVAAQLDYFIHLKGFEGGLFGSLGIYYYF